MPKSWFESLLLDRYCTPSMIDLTPEDVTKFRALFRRETGREITDEEAEAYALNLIRLVAFVARSEKPAP